MTDWDFGDWLMTGKETTKENSLEQKIQAIRSAVDQAVNPRMDPIPSMMASGIEKSYWVREIFDGYAIIDKNGKCYRVNYSLAPDGTVIVSPDLIPVRMAWVTEGTG